MKIVIDIPEEDYKRMIEQSMFGRADVWRKAIQNGTPLPDGAEMFTIDKRTLKAVAGRFVIYDREWLKEHFNTERKLYEKKGKWIRTIDPDVNAWIGGHRCSECGRDCVQMSMNYCANCGAPMEVEK